MPRKINEPPDWWKIELYDFTRGMPLEGWVWEFMRRARLKEILGKAPVDAMNPDPNLDFSKNNEIDYWYMSWPTAIAIYGGRFDHPFYLPPAVKLNKGWPLGFHGQQLQLAGSMKKESKWLGISIDLNRRNTVIVKDLKSLLEDLRTEIPEPTQVKAKPYTWVTGKFLEVWDLHEFNLTYEDIAERLNFQPSENTIYGAMYCHDRAHTTYKEAANYIDNGKWQDIARYMRVR